MKTTYPVPTIAATFDGDRSVVFKSPRDSCNDNDIPDSMARAFRDFNGTVHLMAASSELFQNIGPTLEDVQHSCVPAFISAGDPNPAHYNDHVWLSSFYTFDGLRVAALSHTEYHGWAHPGQCNTPNLAECEYDSDTYHMSTDGGFHYDSFPAPSNFVAGVPYKYQMDDGPTGFSVDTPIIHYRDWFYAVTTSYTWPPNCSGDSGPNRCLISGGGAPIRTRDVFDPSSWRAWSGKDFSVSFAGPYATRTPDPQAHVYAAVPSMSYIYAINIFRRRHDTAGWDVQEYGRAEHFQRGDIVFATLWDVYDNLLGPQGLYFSTSKDLVHWTKPTLVVTQRDLLSHDPAKSYYAYFSVLDPRAPNRNFTIVGNRAYLYYTRLNFGSNPDRVLFRQPIKLKLNP